MRPDKITQASLVAISFRVVLSDICVIRFIASERSQQS